jgi:3-oxoacyl-[acyl-carrier-protein] synthase III
MKEKDSIVAITGTGAYLPARVLTNHDLAAMVDTSDEWILTRTGIRERHIAEEGEGVCAMSAQAARQALERAGVAPDEVDLIVLGSFTPDVYMPSGACLVQDMLGARGAVCFDLAAACSGFLYSLETARCMIAAGSYSTALVIGAEKLSAFVDWEDRQTCVLFGDGAGAVVLQSAEQSAGRGLIANVMGSDGSLSSLLSIPGIGSRHRLTAGHIERKETCLRMAGNEVFKHAVRCMCDAAQKALDMAGMSMEEVDVVVPHQANIRIIQAIENRLGGLQGKFFVNLARVGNMSGASVPVALDEAVRSGRIRKGSIVLSVAFGGGFTWGASLLEWGY